MNRNIPFYAVLGVGVVSALLGFAAGQRGGGADQSLSGAVKEWRAGVAGSVTAVSKTAITITPRDASPVTLPLDENVKVLRAVLNEELKRYETVGASGAQSDVKVGEMVGVNLVSDLRRMRVEEIHILSGVVQP